MTDTETEDPPERVYGEMITDARHLTKLPLGGAETIERYLSCPVCLEIMVAPTATECLHRFCAMCIETSLRLGKKECPSCRLPVATRRALRRDDNFESLLLTLYPDGPGVDEEPVDISALRFKPLLHEAPPVEQPGGKKRERPADEGPPTPTAARTPPGRRAARESDGDTPPMPPGDLEAVASPARQWAPRLTDGEFEAVSRAVLLAIHRGGTLTSEALLPAGDASLPGARHLARRVLLDVLRLLVRVGFLRRERSKAAAPTYVLSKLARQRIVI